jgi:CheY-like chemotaxis protein
MGATLVVADPGFSLPAGTDVAKQIHAFARRPLQLEELEVLIARLERNEWALYYRLCGTEAGSPGEVPIIICRSSCHGEAGERTMKETILLAEDEPRNRKLLRDVLTVKGYVVLEAVNGQEAVDAARAHGPELILLDIQMPVMDGLQAARVLKADKETANIPIWALTSYAMFGDAEKILGAGCDLHLMKPLDIPELLGRIESHFERCKETRPQSLEET